MKGDGMLKLMYILKVPLVLRWCMCHWPGDDAFLASPGTFSFALGNTHDLPYPCHSQFHPLVDQVWFCIPSPLLPCTITLYKWYSENKGIKRRGRYHMVEVKSAISEEATLRERKLLQEKCFDAFINNMNLWLK